MIKYVLLLLLLAPASLPAAECSVGDYDGLVAAGKAANAERDWVKSAEAYQRILGDCSSMVVGADLARAYDALSFAQLMQGDYSRALVGAERCLAADPQYSACMLTAAKANEAIGDRGRALEYLRAILAVEPADDYAAAVAIAARSILKQLEK